MRLVICGIGVLVTSFALTGCGQSGALQLAKDQNYDKRAKYLIYSDSELNKLKYLYSNSLLLHQILIHKHLNSTNARIHS